MRAAATNRRNKDGVRTRSAKQEPKQYAANYYRKNAESIKARVIARRRENPELAAAIQKRDRDRRYATPKGRLESIVRAGIKRGIKLGSKASRKTFDLLTFTAEDLKQHLESSFLPGMTWQNHGRFGWHIDHIRPLASFTYETPDDLGFKEAWKISNLQPLWAPDNLAKGKKWTPPVPVNDNQIQVPKVSTDIAA